MARPFSRTLRALDVGGFRGHRSTLVVLVLLGAWGAWAALGRVPLYETTASARLEVHSAVHPVMVPVGGRVVETKLRLGQAVRAGEVILVLDAESETRALHEKRVRRQSLTARRAALRQEVQAETEALHLQQKAREATVDEARAQVTAAEALASAAEREAQITTRLATLQAASPEQIYREEAEATARSATARAQRLALHRLDQDRGVQDRERRARLAHLEREIVDLDSDAAIDDAGILRLEHEISLRSVRAPIDGRVGEVGEFPVGTVVHAAEKLGAIVPTGTPRAVAMFPTAAVGRLHPGQPARLRLDGYPWTQYGTLGATVADVGNEPSDGRVRVELILTPNQDSAIPMEHGLPGTVEVEVERVSPLVVALRAAGQLLR